MNIDARLLLKNIMASADEALILARQDGVGGAINWGDLSCRGAEKFVDDQGCGGYRCYIEEADPGCTELQEYVSAYLFNKMGVGVQVVTEW